MKIEPGMAIACRDKVEIDVVLQILEKANIYWSGRQKATDAAFLGGHDEIRLYVNPPDDWDNYVYVAWSDDPEDFSEDDEDDIDWTYLEAADLFRNQIISERRKHATSA